MGRFIVMRMIYLGKVRVQGPPVWRVRQALAVERSPGIFISESQCAPGPSRKHGERGFHRTFIHARHDALLAAGV